MEVVMHEASATVSAGESESVPKINGADKEETTSLNHSSIVATQQPIDLQFEDVGFVAEGNGWRKRKKTILHGIHGSFPPGQLIAIMGPSGAGKSTLLDVLSGYRIRGISGTVFANGFPRNLKAFRKSSCYIQQDDRLQPLLTTLENMRIAADLKLDSDMPKAKKERIIAEILDLLGLDKATHTLASGLSGGQKKRLSIALELINNPQVMFLDEPTTGLDSSSCNQCVQLLKMLTTQGRTIVCTIHQPSASLFQLFDQVYVLAGGSCLYQGSTNQLVRFLHDNNFPCPMYHNPADYVIELACGEYGNDKIDAMIKSSGNGRSLQYLDKTIVKSLSKKSQIKEVVDDNDENGLQATSSFNQLKILMRRGYIKTKRDQTLTYTRLMVNVFTAIMLGTLYWDAGSDGSKVIDNYNLLFSILMHHMMSTMMLTILTFPTELSILIKEHFNRWYSLKMYYTTITLIDIPVSVACCISFTFPIYYMTGQPMEPERITMFFVISLLVVFVAQSFGLMIGAVFNVVNGTFLGPTLSVPMMMFAGFGVTLRDLPTYLHWGSYISYLRYGLEGIVGAIYGLNRAMIWCPEDEYCHYKYPKKFLKDIAMRGDQFYNDVIALILILFFMRILAYVLLRYKLMAVR